MKRFFIGVLVLNLLAEGLAAFFLITAPENLFAEGQLEGVIWARNYGFAALAIASTVFWVWPSRDNSKAVGTVLGILLTFHIGLSSSLAIAGDQILAVVHSRKGKVMPKIKGQEVTDMAKEAFDNKKDSLTKYETIRQIMTNWAERFANRIDEAHSK